MRSFKNVYRLCFYGYSDLGNVVLRIFGCEAVYNIVLQIFRRSMDVVFMFIGYQAVVCDADRIPVTGVVGGEIFSGGQSMNLKPVRLVVQ